MRCAVCRQAYLRSAEQDHPQHVLTGAAALNTLLGTNLDPGGST